MNPFIALVDDEIRTIPPAKALFKQAEVMNRPRRPLSIHEQSRFYLKSDLHFESVALFLTTVPTLFVFLGAFNRDFRHVHDRDHRLSPEPDGDFGNENKPLPIS